MVPGFASVCAKRSYETLIDPVWFTLNDQPQFTALPEESWTGRPVSVCFQPQCQPTTMLAYDFTEPGALAHCHEVPQPTRSPLWHVRHKHCEPVPLEAPHTLLFNQYLPTSMLADAAHVLPICAALPQLTLAGSTHAPYKHCVAPVHFMPQVPQFCGSLVTSTHVPEQAACGAGQVHTPAAQLAPLAQTLVQLPQLFTLVLTSWHAPLHTACPVGQRHMPE